jgi:pimeloyl-ACP methyl ester carboxylesterase
MLNDTPLLVVAGTGCPGVFARSFYGHFQGLSSGPVRIEPIPNLGFGHIREAVETLEKRYFWDHRWDKVDIIGHSQGALIALAMAIDHPHHVRKVICLGGPFHGSKLAPNWAPFSGGRCLSWQSRWVMGHLQVPARMDVYSFYSTSDQVVRPWRSSHLLGAKNIIVSPTMISSRLYRDEEWLPARCGHVGLATNSKVLDRIEYALYSS